MTINCDKVYNLVLLNNYYRKSIKCIQLFAIVIRNFVKKLHVCKYGILNICDEMFTTMHCVSLVLIVV